MPKAPYTIVWSFRNRPGELIDSITTADKTCPKTVNFQLVDAASDIETLNTIHAVRAGISDRDIRVCEAAYRTTCQEAWNLGIMLSNSERIVITSSDVDFLPGWFEAMDEAFNKGGEYIILNNHSVFGLSMSAIAKTGWFDEEFKHGPHVDVDFMIRASEAGVKLMILGNDNYYIHDKEALKYSDRINQNLENRLPMSSPHNEQRFKDKWQSSWPGWEHLKGTGTDLPHPPTNIKEVQRKIAETDYHPAYTKRIRGA